MLSCIAKHQLLLNLHMLRRLFVVLLLTFIQCLSTAWLTPVHAQLPVFRNYNTENGLPSSETYQITQDSRGYIYIGSDKGLTRFDGRRFETLTTQEGLINNTLFTLITHKDEVWYYTYSSQVGYLRQDTLYAYRHNNVIAANLSSALWSSIVLDDEGMLYLNKRLEKEGGYEIIGIHPDGTPDRSLSTPLNADYAAIYVAPGKRWLKSGPDSAKKVKVFSLQSGKLLHEFVAERAHLPPLVAPYGARKGNKIWLLYKDIYLLQGKTCQKVVSCPEYPLHMLVDKDENIWVGYDRGGLKLYLKKDNYANPIQMLPQLSISCILEDREGGFWFSTLENGIYYLPPDFLYAYDQRTGLSASKTIQVSYFKKDAFVWQSDYSLWRLKNGDGNSWDKPFGNLPIHAIAIVPDSSFYTFSPYIHSAVKGYTTLSLSKLYSDGYRAWGIDNGYLVPAIDNKFQYKNRLPEILPFVVCLKTLQGDRLLAGTLHGLYLYEQYKFRKLPLAQSFDKERISDIEVLDEQHLLVATSGKGILVLRKKDFSIVRHLTAANGLKNMICNVILNDSGKVWVGTNMGLYKIEHILEPEQTTITWATIHDGISSNEVNDICVVKQDLWLGTAKGVCIFPRNKKLRFEDSIPVMIQKLTVNGKAGNSAGSMQLPYNQNNISISFIGLNYRYASVLQYRYRLMRNKTEEAWSYTNDPVVNYNELPSGDYIFEYGAMAPNQYGKKYAGSLTFTITPPFWLRWWFLLLAALLVISCLVLFLHFRLRSIRRQVKLKTDLGIYRDKALRDQMSPHFIYNALNTIQNYILKHDTDLSVSFLSKFSRLMRLIFHNTVQEMVTIEKDLEALQLYTQMESMRFPGKLNIHLPERLPESLKKARIPVVVAALC